MYPRLSLILLIPAVFTSTVSAVETADSIRQFGEVVVTGTNSNLAKNLLPYTVSVVGEHKKRYLIYKNKMSIWNPWHGCHKISAGCKHCYMFRGDELRGARHPSDEVHKTSMFNLPIRKERHGNWKFPAGSHFWLCFTSDLLIEEADQWRDDIWRMIRLRNDCHFTFLTKRPERLSVCLPKDWDDGYPNVTIGCTIENQDRADYRLPIFLSQPISKRIVMAEPLLGPIDIRKYLDTGLIESVSVGGESGHNVRHLDFDWVKNLYTQCNEAGVDFHFHQTGANFIKDGREYNIPRKFQHEQAEKAMEILRKMS